MKKNTFNRRDFIRSTGVLAGGYFLQGFSNLTLRVTNTSQYKAAVIGRTGAGNYGHGLDAVFNNVDNIDVVAVADVDKAGARKAVRRSGAEAIYTDYREMLRKEKPDLVCVAMRHPQWHKEIALEAIKVGAHLYIEKPMTEYPAEAYSIVQAAEEKKLKIGVAHHRRYMKEFLGLKNLLEDGLIGEILEIRCYGKQDRRVGGEDLIVLGTHGLDYMRYLLGDPIWCSASVTVNGKDIQPSDVQKGYEPYLVAGDTVRAQYAFPGNIHGYWSSIKTGDQWNNSARAPHDPLEDRQKWGFDIFGTKGIVYYRSNDEIKVLRTPYPAPGVEHVDWYKAEIEKLSIPKHQTHPIRSLLHAIEHETEPQCSGKDGRWAIEMVSAVYQSQIQGKRIAFPLNDREHPLVEFKNK